MLSFITIIQLVTSLGTFANIIIVVGCLVSSIFTAFSGVSAKICRMKYNVELTLGFTCVAFL